ncbi:Holliday junction branch migration protein RuvA [bacterium]|nr:Holliday junction branch migration protein RuvA [bacterium]
MIDRIRGKCLQKNPAEIVVEIGGIALAAAIPLTTFERVGRVGSEISLFTYLYVREAILDLYGFSTVEERDLFKLLINVNGVGPKMALAILSQFSPQDLLQVVLDGESRRLTAVKGIGAKTAERLMVELKGRLRGISSEITDKSAGGSVSPKSEAIKALEALGFTLQQADSAVRKVCSDQGDDLPVEEIVRTALKG